MLLGKTHYGRPRPYGYGAITLYGPVSNPVRLRHGFITPAGPVGTRKTASHNPIRATPDGYHTRTVWPAPLSLATTHGISFPAGTEMFHFPAYPPAETGTGPSRPVGSPIRRSSDQSPLGGSPRHIAARDVLHRSCLPRHPPHALASNPQNQKTKLQGYRNNTSRIHQTTHHHI